MQYSEILKDVLDGKWVKSAPTRVYWVRMLENGKWECDIAGTEFTLQKYEMLKNTWEVKPEEVYVWYAPATETQAAVFNFEGHGSYDSRLKKYKLVQVED